MSRDRTPQSNTAENASRRHRDRRGTDRAIRRQGFRSARNRSEGRVRSWRGTGSEAGRARSAKARAAAPLMPLRRFPTRLALTAGECQARPSEEGNAGRRALGASRFRKGGSETVAVFSSAVQARTSPRSGRSRDKHPPLIMPGSAVQVRPPLPPQIEANRALRLRYSIDVRSGAAGGPDIDRTRGRKHQPGISSGHVPRSFGGGQAPRAFHYRSSRAIRSRAGRQSRSGWSRAAVEASPMAGQALSIMERILSASASMAKGLLSISMPGSSTPLPTAALWA